MQKSIGQGVAQEFEKSSLDLASKIPGNSLIHGKVVWKDGSYYIGHWKNGKRCGKGKYVEPNGSVTEGVWEYGLIKVKE